MLILFFIITIIVFQFVAHEGIRKVEKQRDKLLADLNRYITYARKNAHRAWEYRKTARTYRTRLMKLENDHQLLQKEFNMRVDYATEVRATSYELRSAKKTIENYEKEAKQLHYALGAIPEYFPGEQMPNEPMVSWKEVERIVRGSKPSGPRETDSATADTKTEG